MRESEVTVSFLTATWAAPFYVLGFSMHVSSFTKIFFLIKKEVGKREEKERKDLTMFIVPSKSRLPQFMTGTCQNHVLREELFAFILASLAQKETSRPRVQSCK